MILDPLAMEAEAQRLDSLGAADVRSRTFIDPGALIATPFQAIVNRVRERARENRHGSCGCGIGETVADSLAGQALHAADLAQADAGLIALLASIRARQLDKLCELTAERGNWQDYATINEIALLTSDAALEALCARYADFAGEYQIADRLTTLMQKTQTVIYEGAQGVLLDEWYGFHPYTTWSTTTDSNALALLVESEFAGGITRLGIVRTYMTRHGNGPLVTESPYLTKTLVDAHNGTGEFQGAFRCGEFDAVVLRYAISVNQGIDALAVTHCDIPQQRWSYCTAYQFDGNTPGQYFDSRGSEITGIRANPCKKNLDYQEGLTRHFSHCRPVLQARALPSMEQEPFAVCSAISDLLAVPVALAAWGPTVGQRVVLDDNLLPVRKIGDRHLFSVNPTSRFQAELGK